VTLLALIAGTASYLHMHTLAESHNQPGWVAVLTAMGRVITAWPSLALIAVCELLMRQVRHLRMLASPRVHLAGRVR
jgi:hypothetical protein